MEQAKSQPVAKKTGVRKARAGGNSRKKKSGEATVSNSSTARLVASKIDCTAFEGAEYEKKVAVVVGGSSGIGYHTAIALCREGFRVYNISRTDAEPQLVENIHADVCDSAELAEAIASVHEQEGQIDVLVYSAGRSIACPLEHTPEHDFRKLFEVNYFGLIKALWAVIPIMRNQGHGRIVAVSSLAGSSPIPFDAGYSASKAAIDITLRSLAIELFPYNIKLTSVQPGGVHTRFTYKRKIYPAEQVGTYNSAMQKAVAKLDMTEQNGIEPRDVATCIARLLSEKNPPISTPVGLKDRALKAVSKLLPTMLTDYLDRMAWE